MKKNEQALGIILVLIICCALMYLVEVYLLPTYFIKSLFKLLLFAVVPLIYYKVTKEKFKKLFTIDSKKAMFMHLILGIVVYAAMLAGYFILKSFIDLDNVRSQLSENLKVNKDNFIFVALYISFINSLLEEFFFRGFGYLTLKKHISEGAASIISAFMFSVYHVAILNSWFSPWLFLFIIVGLVVVGLFFNWVNRKNENIYNSWFIHMFANFATNTVGLIMFGIIG